MTVGKRKRGGEEDTGEKGGKKKARVGAKEKIGSQREKQNEKQAMSGKNSNEGQAERTGKPQMLKILPGESLRAFNRRVDMSMPVVFKYQRGSSPDPGKPGKSSSTSNPNPKSAKACDKKPSLAEEQDYSDYLTDDTDEYSVDARGNPIPKLAHNKRNSKPKQKKPSAISKRNTSPDPFAKLAESRGKIRFGETVSAPPQINFKPKEILKVRGFGRDDGAHDGDDDGNDKGGFGSGTVGVSKNVAGVPKKSGSLARREVLGMEREGVLARYRELMMGKRTRREDTVGT